MSKTISEVIDADSISQKLQGIETDLDSVTQKLLKREPVIARQIQRANNAVKSLQRIFPPKAYSLKRYSDSEFDSNGKMIQHPARQNFRKYKKQKDRASNSRLLVSEGEIS